MSSTANRVVKNTGFLYAKMGITMFVSLYTTRLILNSLGASDFGIYNIVGGAIGMLGFLNAAMASATQRFMSYSEGESNLQKEKSIFNVSIILHFLIALIAGVTLVIVGYFFFHGILNIPEKRISAAKVVYGSLIISTMFTVMTVPYDATMNAHENMRYYALVGILESFLKLAVAFACVYTSKDKLIVYGVLMACVPLVSLTIMRIYCHRHYEECITAPRKYWDKELMKEMTSFAGWNFVGSIGSIVGNYGNGIVVNHFFGAILNAALGIANQLNGQLMAFSNNMMKALNPVIVKNEGAKNRDDMIRYSLVGCKFPFLLLAFFSVPFLIETPYILKLWLKTVPEWTIAFTRLQIIRSLLELLTLGLGTSLSAVGKIKELNIYTLVLDLLPLAILTILFSFGFSPYWLYIIAIFFMVIIADGIKIFYCIQYCDLKLYNLFHDVFYPAIICIGGALMIGILPEFFLSEGILRLLVCLMTSFLSFLVLSYSIGLSVKERQHVNELLLKLRIKKHG